MFDSSECSSRSRSGALSHAVVSIRKWPRHCQTGVCQNQPFRHGPSKWCLGKMRFLGETSAHFKYPGSFGSDSKSLGSCWMINLPCVFLRMVSIRSMEASVSARLVLNAGIWRK